MSDIAAVVVSGAVSLILLLSGLLLNRRLGLTDAQKAYVGTLEGMNDALEDQVRSLREELAGVKTSLEEAHKLIASLERQVRELTSENLDLRRRIDFPGRDR